jgi:hypothetical protein
VPGDIQHRCLAVDLVRHIKNGRNHIPGTACSEFFEWNILAAGDIPGPLHLP